jgi:hypothetical protein
MKGFLNTKSTYFRLITAHISLTKLAVPLEIFARGLYPIKYPYLK